MERMRISRARRDAGVTLAELAVETGLAASCSAARRLAAGGGLRLDGVAVESAAQVLPLATAEWLLSAGRRQHARIVLAAQEG
jgi:tyrosyl-tRNA synthetase